MSSSVTLTESVIAIVTASAAIVVLTLPLASKVSEETTMIKKVSGTYAVRVVPQGTDKVDGGTLLEITELMAAYTLYSDGTNWHVI